MKLRLHNDEAGIGKEKILGDILRKQKLPTFSACAYNTLLGKQLRHEFDRCHYKILELLNLLKCHPNAREELAIRLNDAESDLQEIQRCWEKTFASEACKRTVRVREELLGNLQMDYLVAENIVAGQKLSNNFLPYILESAIVITGRRSFDFFIDEIPGFKFPNERLYYTIDIKSGEELKSIINIIMGNANIRYVIGIGGSIPINIMQFIGFKTGATTIAIPTSLATHIYASPKISALPPIQDLGYKLTIDGIPPHLALLELELLEKLNRKHPRLVKSGFGDLMAFFTAKEDWKLAIKYGIEKPNRLVSRLIDFIIDQLKYIDINMPFREWVKTYNHIQVLLCYITDWVGSAPASGSEHLFAKCAEAGLAEVPLHGELVALGTLIMSYLQGNDYITVKKLMRKFNIPDSLGNTGIDKSQLLKALINSKLEGKRKNRFTFLDTVNLSESDWIRFVEKLLSGGIITE